MAKSSVSTNGLAATTEMSGFELNVLGGFIWNVYSDRYIQIKHPKSWGGTMVMFDSLTWTWLFYIYKTKEIC